MSTPTSEVARDRPGGHRSAPLGPTHIAHRSRAGTASGAHWPEYLIEAWALGTFMISAGLFATLFEYPGSPVHAAIADPFLRRLLIGLAMGLTAVGLIHSPWGQQSGAHMNPAVTLTFLRLGKVRPVDAAFYVGAQFIGGTLGVILVAALLGPAFAAPPVSYAATMPGEPGVAVAFLAELLISAVLMLVILVVSNSRRYARWTGIAAGCMVAIYITLEAPLSGMSMNPARSFASAAPGGLWSHLWLYFTAPPLGMLAAAQIYVALHSRAAVHCAKLDHSPRRRCIHCGYQPPSMTTPQRSGTRA
jgi:aquaporin Z